MMACQQNKAVHGDVAARGVVHMWAMGCDVTPNHSHKQTTSASAIQTSQGP